MSSVDETVRESSMSEVAPEYLVRVEWRWLMHNMILQMMFVSGEEAEPSVQTTTIIEEIVREQVVELVSWSLISLYQPILVCYHPLLSFMQCLYSQ